MSSPLLKSMFDVAMVLTRLGLLLFLVCTGLYHIFTVVGIYLPVLLALVVLYLEWYVDKLPLTMEEAINFYEDGDG